MALDRILRIREVQQVTGLGKSTIYQKINRGEFPKPLQLARQTVGWRESTIQQWIESLVPAETTAAA